MPDRTPDRAIIDRVVGVDRKSTRLNSSHLVISYAVFCLKKKKAIGYPLALLVRPGDRPRYWSGPTVAGCPAAITGTSRWGRAGSLAVPADLPRAVTEPWS